MDKEIENLLKILNERGEAKCTFDMLLDVFRNNYNWLKGETPYGETLKWLEKGSVIFGFEYLIQRRAEGDIVFFKKIYKPEICPKCSGEGNIYQIHEDYMSSKLCHNCNGEGKITLNK